MTNQPAPVFCDLCDELIEGEPHTTDDYTLCDECFAQCEREDDEVWNEQEMGYNKIVSDSLAKWMR